MAENDFKLRVEGPDAEKVAGELAAFIEREWGYKPNRMVKETGRGSHTEANRTDPVAVVAVILTIPPAVVAMLDLKERMELRKKVDQLIRWEQERRTQNPQTRTDLIAPDGRAEPLHQADGDEIIDAANQAEKSP